MWSVSLRSKVAQHDENTCTSTHKAQKLSRVRATDGDNGRQADAADELSHQRRRKEQIKLTELAENGLIKEQGQNADFNASLANTDKHKNTIKGDVPGPGWNSKRPITEEHLSAPDKDLYYITSAQSLE